MEVAAILSCRLGSDNQLGPRVDIHCRPFDFTLLFEDLFFILVPAALLILLLPSRLRFLRHESVKVESYKLAIWKLLCIACLFALHVAFTAFQQVKGSLRTKVSLASSLINIIAILAAGCFSFIEDQRSFAPSNILVIYFSASSILNLPRLRSLWLIESTSACRGLWTSITVFTVFALFTESASKANIVRSSYHITKEQLCNLWGRSFFTWLFPFFQLGYSKIITLDDIPSVDDELTGEVSQDKLQASWKVTQGKHRLLKACLHAFLGSFLSGISPRLALLGFTFAQPFLITATIDYMSSEQTEDSKKYGQALVGAYVLTYAGTMISTSIYWRQVFRFSTTIRSGLISMIFTQTMNLRNDDLSDSAAVTLMGTDVERIMSASKSIHEAWSSFVAACIAIWLLERELWIACLIPLAIALGCVVAMGPISTRSGSAQKQWIEKVQERLAVTSSMLGDMKAVQMLGLSSKLFSIISKLRKIELTTSVRFRKLLIWQVALSNVPVVLAPFATFAIYAAIAVIRKDDSILSAKAFTSLALISLLTGPLLMFCQAMPSLLQGVACLDRIEEYLELVSIPLSEQSIGTSPLNHSSTSSLELQRWRTTSDGRLFSFNKANISRSLDTDHILREMTFDIKKGITMIIGPVGSGKSTLLASLIGENTLKSGSVTTSAAKIAFCAQDPWIINDTIRNNIVGVSDFEQKWYDTVCAACGLENDLQGLPGGDSRITGSNGVSLSGGQKQRVALARAVYSPVDILVLDNIFSGLDQKTIASISNNLFSTSGHFRTASRSVILATNTYHMLAYADAIIVLDEGRVVDQGSYEELKIRMPEIIASTHISEDDKMVSTEEDKLAHPNSAGVAAETTNNEVIDLLRQQGSWSVYGYYFRSAGYSSLIICISCVLIECFGVNFSTIWIQWWVESNEREPNQHLAFYLGIYGLLFSMTFFGILAGCWAFFLNIVSNSSLNLHSDLLKATLNAPISFFQITDTGATTNRFSQDMELIDMMLPIYAINFVGSVFSCLIKLIILCVVGKYLAVSIPFALMTLYFIQAYYLRTSRQVRLLDIEAKAPLYTHFLETIQGISTIRAFKWGPQFQKTSQHLLNESQKPVYMLYCVQQWLTLVLDLVVGVIAVILVAMVTSLKDDFSAASIGVALNLLLTFNETLSHLIKMWTMMETSIGAIQRVQDFSKDTPSEARNGVLPPPQNWPTRGAIKFQSVTAGYATNTTAVLKDLNLTIQPGQKIAVCGPSGSGKTSLVMALLQMLEVQDGFITIDGLDLSTIDRNHIRASINAIPQDAFFMPGTVRFNVDPHNRASDAEMEYALKKIGLWSKIEGLDAEFSSSEWSVGERQLFALARAMLIKSPILVLDEATSSVDWETEPIMQKIIEEEFVNQTIISVVHRFRYIDRFDYVALIKQGQLVEFESSAALLGMNSEFKKLYLALQEGGQ